jgi:FSR family fosmidomycin resistance protein-like MFS transporter
MGLWMVGGELGRTIGPLVVVTALRYLTMAELPWLMIGGVVASAVIYRQLKDLPPPKVNGQAHLPILQRLKAMKRLIGPLAILLTGRAFFVNAMTTFLPVFLTEGGFDIQMAGISLSVLEAAGVAGALIGGALSDRLGRRRLLLASTLLAPTFMLAFLITEGWTHFPLLILIGFTGLSVAPVMMAVVQENYPDDRALANGAYMFLNFGIRSVVVIVLGAMSDLMGMQTAYIVSGVMAFIGVPSVLLLPQPAKNS